MLWMMLPPQWAHDISRTILPYYGKFFSSAPPKWSELSWRHLRFPNPVGIAGGVDKEGSSINSWFSLGAGFVEVGTVTLRPQHSNPGTILMRDPSHKALWNKMGFPSLGVKKLIHTLESFPKPFPGPLFINIGKNRNTPLHEATEDYTELTQLLAPYADALVVNISSPNTQNLRELQKADHLDTLLSKIQKAKPHSDFPLFIKLSPDLSHEELSTTLKICVSQNIDGFIFTNTTLSRPPNTPFPKGEGGLSGKPLAELSKKNLTDALEILGSDRANKLIISTGGVFTFEDVQERLAMGAHLVQVYTALVYEGPRLFKKWKRVHDDSTT